MKQKKVYLSGPISGLARDEYMAAFAQAESTLRMAGYKVYNPTRFLPCRWRWLYWLMGYRLTLCYDLWWLMHCDIIALLPGYDKSRGANIEKQVAFHFGLSQMEVFVTDTNTARI